MQCGECQKAFASIVCLECHESYCTECANTVHQKGRRKLHTKFIRQVVCVECEEKAASLKCEECQDFFCHECSGKMHHKGMRQTHNVHPLDGDELKVVNHDTINAFAVSTKDIVFGTSELDQGALAEINDCLEIAGNKVLASAMCSIPPEDAQVRTVISVSTEDNDVVRLKEDTEHLMVVTERMREKFGEVMSHFHCWRRWRSISQNASLYCEHKKSTTHQRPALLYKDSYDVTTHDHINFIPFFHRSVIDDHFFQLAVAAVCTRRCLLMDNLVSCEYAERGLFTYKFYSPQTKVDGSSDFYQYPWVRRVVNVDSMLPCSRDLQVAVGRTTHKDEFYLALLSKAYATQLRSYAHLHKGCTVEALMRLTGGEPTVVQWNSDKISPKATAELWWLVNEATKWGCTMVAMDATTAEPLEEGIDLPLEELDKEADTITISYRTTGLNWGELAKPRVVFFGLPYDPKQIGNEVRLLKTRALYATPGGLNSFPESRPWADTGKEWTKETRVDLQHYNVDGRVEWVTVEDFVRHVNCFAFIRNNALTPKRTFISRIPLCLLHEQALHLPHFLLEIEKIDDHLSAGGELNFNENYMRLDELEVPALIAGDETDDEVDPMAASNASTPRSSVVDGPIAASAAQCNVLIRISQPKCFSQPFEGTVMAFRVSKPERQAPVRSFEDGFTVFSLPVHSRVGVKKVAQLSDTEELYELPANTGCYNIVYVPEQKLTCDVLFSASIEHRNETYSMRCNAV